MAQTINPNSFRLGSKLTWWSIAHYNIKNTSLSINGFQIFHNDLLIRKYVEQVFNNFNILVSEIIITRKHTTGIELQYSRSLSSQLKNRQLKTDMASNLFNKIQMSHMVKYDNSNILNQALYLYPSLSNVQFSQEALINYEPQSEKENITLEFVVYFHTNNEKERKIRNISIFLKNLLENILNNKSNKFNIKFNIKEIPNPTYNVNVLSSWIGQELSNNPRRHKAILKKALYLINSNKK